MVRQISSRITLFQKIVFPILFALSVATFCIQGLLSWHTPTAEMPWLMVLMSVAFLSLSLYLLWPLKKVAIDDDNLYVSDFLTEITLPITEIERVSEFMLSKPRRVTIHLKNPTKFGRKIVFLAAYRSFSPFSSHPTVSELNELARRKG